MRGTALILSILLAGTPVPAARTLDIYFIDVEGGQATLIVTPAGESLLVDAGYGGRVGTRDALRIADAARDAGVDRIDYLLITHFHPDHVGGVPELAQRLPIGTFIDYGAPLGTDRRSTGGFRAYEPLRSLGRHIEARAGEQLPFKGLRADVISAGGTLLPAPLAGAGLRNPACVDLEDHPEDGTENYRSVGVLFRFGAFSFLNPGDLSGNTLTRLVCPANLVGTASVYLVAHHGDYDTNVPALYAAIRPRVAIMNNGAIKGGSPVHFRTLSRAGLDDLWQLHASRTEGVKNAPDDFIANLDDGTTSYWIKLTADENGSFRIVNSRTEFGRTYPAAK